MMKPVQLVLHYSMFTADSSDPTELWYGDQPKDAPCGQVGLIATVGYPDMVTCLNCQRTREFRRALEATE